MAKTDIMNPLLPEAEKNPKSFTQQLNEASGGAPVAIVGRTNRLLTNANQSLDSFWYNDFINYEGLVGRWRMFWPNIDFMTIFAEKKASILVQGAKFTFTDMPIEKDDDGTLTERLKEFLRQFDLQRMLIDCIEQASMNGYAVLDIERILFDGQVKTCVYVNPFPSAYDQWNYTTMDDEIQEIIFQTCFTSQRFQTPNVVLIRKNSEGFNICNVSDQDLGGYLMASPMSMEKAPNIADFFFQNQLTVDHSVKYEQLTYGKGEKLYPYMDRKHKTFYVFRNRPFTLGYKNLIQNSDMWFLGQLGHLIPSSVERNYQEQEQNISRTIGSFDPVTMEMYARPLNSFVTSANEHQFNTTHNMSWSAMRHFQFTTADGQSVTQIGSTFVASQEIQGFKDWMDTAFKLAVGFDLFGESATRESTATENLQRSISERENIIMLTNFYKRQLKEVFKSVIFFEFGKDYADCWDIAIENQRGDITPAETQDILSKYQAGLISKRLAIKKLNPNMTDFELKEEEEAINADQMYAQQQQAMMNPSSLQDPSQTSLNDMEEQNNNEQLR